MEPEVKAFLARIVKSLSMTLLWMLVNMSFGIFFNLGFIEGQVSLGNIIFYVFCLGSLSALIWYLLKIWKEALQA